MQVVRAGIWTTIGGAALGAVVGIILVALGTRTSGLLGFGEVMAAFVVGTLTLGLVAANVVGGISDRAHRHRTWTRIPTVDESTIATGSRCSCRRLRIRVGDTWVCPHCDHVPVG